MAASTTYYQQLQSCYRDLYAVHFESALRGQQFTDALKKLHLYGKYEWRIACLQDLDEITALAAAAYANLNSFAILSSSNGNPHRLKSKMKEVINTGRCCIVIDCKTNRIVQSLSMIDLCDYWKVERNFGNEKFEEITQILFAKAANDVHTAADDKPYSKDIQNVLQMMQSSRQEILDEFVSKGYYGKYYYAGFAFNDIKLRNPLLTVASFMLNGVIHDLMKYYATVSIQTHRRGLIQHNALSNGLKHYLYRCSLTKDEILTHQFKDKTTFDSVLKDSNAISEEEKSVIIRNIVCVFNLSFCNTNHKVPDWKQWHAITDKIASKL